MPINNTASSKDENHPDLATVQALLGPEITSWNFSDESLKAALAPTHRAGKDQTGKVQAWHSYQDVWATVPGNQAQCPSKHVAVIVQWFTTFGRSFLPTASTKPTVTAAASTTTPTRTVPAQIYHTAVLAFVSKESSFWCIGSRLGICNNSRAIPASSTQSFSSATTHDRFLWLQVSSAAPATATAPTTASIPACLAATTHSAAAISIPAFS